ATAELVLRLVGLRPAVRPRLLLRAIDTDIDLPFMRADPDLFWSPRPGFRGSFMDRPVTINSVGLRGAELRARRAGARRVACFGDSITFGYGVGDDETYPRLLDRALAPDGTEAVNAGVTGYTSHQVRRLVTRVADMAPFDIALVCIGWNDGTWRPVDDREYERRLRSVNSVEGVADRFYIYRALKGLYVRSLVRGVQEQRRTTPRVPVPQYRENLGAIVEACRSRRVRPVFVGLPHRRLAGDPPVDRLYPGAFESAARELDVPLLDPGELGTTSSATNGASFIDSLHLSPAGHERMAEAILRQLRALGIV
ncbi:MAG TPA: GDSL-type esterase/lipase family protein, partial [Vicinamibacteria bacterium]|nr:GDSL-type esterase/lipase family protein [Vicinamibacteria bacterium]